MIELELIKLKRRECAVLPLVLMGEWYDKIRSGSKDEEYRTSPRVMRQIQRWWGLAKIESLIPIVEFRHGYAKDSPRMCLVASGVFFRRAGEFINPDLGEPTDAPHYVIKLDGRVQFQPNKKINP